jgi:hypothetical protein
MNMQFKAAPAHCFTVGKFVEIEYDDGNHYDGKITTVIGSMACVEFFYLGDAKTVTRGFNELRLVDQITADWWSTILDPLSEEEVLGDSEPDLTKIDTIGRGKKGFGHGSIDWKPVTRKRKNGKIWTTKQPWFQWEDQRGKHCRYLRKGNDLMVQKLIDSGADVETVLDAIGHDKNEKKRKTR